MSKLGQEPAFGFEYSTFKGTPPIKTRTFHHPMGMSKRFYAACAAMQGLLANPSMIDNNNLDMGWIAKHAFMQADELLKQEEL